MSLQWFCDMTPPRRSRRSRRSRRAGCASPRPSGARSTSTGCARSAPGASRASCGGATRSPSGTAATSCTSGRTAARGRGLGRATRTCSTPGSARRSGRSPRSAGPSETPELAKFYPTQVLSTARDIIFLWVARMVMMGVEYTGTEPFSDVYIHSVVQARRRPAHEQVARHRRRPARADRPQRRRRPALRAADDVEHPGRALQRRPHRPGPPARHQALERRPPGRRPRRPGRARHAARRSRSPTAGSPRASRPPSSSRASTSTASSSRSSPTSSTTWSSTTTATGTSSC